MIYFDNAATTEPADEVIKTFERILKSDYGNPSSPHSYGRAALDILDKARAQIGRHLGFDPSEIIFTSGATESNNLAIQGIVNRYPKRGKRIITTKVEHASVLEPIKELELKGYDVVWLDVAPNGEIDFAQYQNALTPDTVLISIMAVNNETGIIFPIAKLAAEARRRTSAFFHTDATQALFKVPLDLKDVDLVSMSAHKLNGFKGSGLLLKRRAVDLAPQILGGGQENGYRSGTSNPPLAAAMAATLRRAAETVEIRRRGAGEIRAFIYDELALMSDSVIITSPRDGSPFILGFALKKHKASVLVEALAGEGIMVSTKSACSSKHVGGSYVLKALGYEREITENAIRLSFSGYETKAQAQTFIETLRRLLAELKER